MKNIIRGGAVVAATAALMAMGALSASAAEETFTILDPENAAGADSWQVTETDFDPDCPTLNGPAGPVPYDAINNNGSLTVNEEGSLGLGCYEGWTGYDDAPNEWVVTKTFTAPEDGFALLEAYDFIADGGARVLINGVDVGLYTQWNEPAVGGSESVPVTAGENTIQIVVRDVGGPAWIRGRLDITTFEEDDIPVVAPAVALGAGALALGGLGILRLRRNGQGT